MESTTTDIVYSCSGMDPKGQPKKCNTNPHHYLLFMSHDEMMEYFNSKGKDDDDEIQG